MENHLEVNRDLIEAMKSIKDFKSGHALTNAYYKSELMINQDVARTFDAPERLEMYVIDQLIHRISKHITEQKKDQIAKEQSNDMQSTRYSLDLMITTRSEFMEIVEYCVRKMPQSAIDKIRG